ncbi:hypothetical protein ElyMa_003862300 [Elysia marginata]|uniref:Uncharacterized protein n=1 Tax=Elysia marginata TaxID=1093978 RepID=A0AAV4FIW8_9GAST|nr:hypothetical protein ElyMa_003862300 [Elysia marginata]
MTPKIDLREEGNSVDPPSLQHLHQPSPTHVADSFVSDGPLSSHHTPTSNPESGLPNSATFVFESSTTSSRACLETFSSAGGVEKMSTFVIDRNAHTTSISTTGKIPSSNESNLASGCVSVGGEQLHILTSGSLPDLELTQQSSGGPYDECPKKKVSCYIPSNLEQTKAQVNTANDKRENCVKTDQIQEEHSVSGFNFDQTKLAYRLKPQLTSEFLSKEILPCTDRPTENVDIDTILRKYGLETKKYNSPVVNSKHGHGDTAEAAVTSTVNSYSSYSSCKFVSTYNSSKEFYRPQMNLSQNNEALSKLTDPSSKPIGAESKLLEMNTHQVPLLTPSNDSKTEQEAISKNSGTTFLPQSENNQQLSVTSHSSTNIDNPVKHDYSKNNDIQETDNFPHKPGASTGVELSVAHGSSVDVAVNNLNESLQRQGHATPLNYGGHYSGLRGALSVTSNSTQYGRMGVAPGIVRNGGFGMSAYPSNMDLSPFEGSYLKHHLTSSEQSAPTSIAAVATSDIASSGQSVTASNRDSSSAAGSSLPFMNHSGSPTDSLNYSLQKERYRLRGIDNLITSGPRHIPRPYSTMPYTSIHTASNFPILSTYRGSATSMGSVLASAASYNSPNDIANIRRAGSNVDTGQFNNNRGVLDNRYRHDRYGSEMAERLGLHEAWVKESTDKKYNPAPYTAQQMQNQKQEPQKQRSGRNIKNSACENIIERNRLAVSKNSLYQSKRFLSARDRKKTQRPKSAQAVSNSMNNSDYTYQANNSFSSFPDGSGCVNKMKRISKSSVWEKDTSRTNASGYAKTKSNNTNRCEVSTKGEEKIENRRSKLGHVVNGLPDSNKRQAKALKYQPYVTRAKETEGDIEGQLLEAQSVSDVAPSKSSSIASRSQVSCNAVESDFSDDNQLQSFPKESTRCSDPGKTPLARCISCQDASQRSLVAATALASALIHKRQLQLEKFKMFLPDYCSRETRKRSVPPETSNNTAGTSSMKMPAGVKKNPKKRTSSIVRPNSTRPHPYIDYVNKYKCATKSMRR